MGQGNVDYSPVLSAHALDTGTDTDINHASLDLVGNVDAGLETRRALAVEGTHGGVLGESGSQAGRAHLGGTATGGKYGSYANVLNVGGIDSGALNNGGKHTDDEVGGGGVLEATLATLGEGGSAASSDDDLD